jgi:hypothetical protein
LGLFLAWASEDEKYREYDDGDQNDVKEFGFVFHLILLY